MLDMPQIIETGEEAAAVIHLTIPRSDMPSVFEQAGDLWELYSVGPQSQPDAAQWRTELNLPLAN